MTIAINRLLLRADTADGPYGVDIPFSKGLFILRVENTHGKSTCINSIAYALGMEMALGQVTSKPPFPPSLLKNIQNENGTEIPVISSYVMLEISNDRGQIYTLKREILGADAESIITVYESNMESISGNGRNLFIHLEGDTSRELGFYHWLADFISWDLPLVPNNSGKESPLYPVLLFPLFFVEQKKGWSSIQATTPFHLQIIQAKKRAFEFLMDMDVNETVNNKAKNKKLLDDVHEKWKQIYIQLETNAIRLHGKIQGVKDVPAATFDSFKLDVLLEHQGKWQSLNSALIGLRAELTQQIKQSQPIVTEQKNESLLNRLRELNNLVMEKENQYEFLVNEISFVKSQITSTEVRIENLVDDKRKYEDLKKVKSFSILDDLPVLNNECPTCGREYSDYNLEIECSDDLMTLEESLDFIKSQITTFKSVLNSYNVQLDIKNIELNKLEKQLDSYSADITRLKREMYSERNVIDEESLREKIRLENQIAEYEKGLVALADFRSKFDILHNEYKQLVVLRRNFPEHGFSQKDIDKLDALRTKVVKYLSEFGFSSFDPQLLGISKDTYLPTREGFDLGFDTSASDGIRIIWSYLISLFSLRDLFKTNHPAILIFDEPRQQEANKVSFTGLLKGASEAANSGQIIFATSEEEDVLENALQGCDYTLHSYSPSEGKILRKLQPV
ncbi:MAG: hypothetical protein ACT6RZ_03765 [Methylophilus sp.]|uniref:hypothetical protein n=2 Tax=Methylophilus sp. TaxID=29541 RepID=UPI004036142E